MIPEDALQIVLNGLDCCGIPYMITGSFAGNLHGVPRVTHQMRHRAPLGVRNLSDLFDPLPDCIQSDFEEVYHMDYEVKDVKMEDEFKICPSCGYKDGFHSMFKKKRDIIKWLFICPACHIVFDIGFTA